MDSKCFFKSKTILIAAIQAALIAFSPFIENFVKNNPTLYAGLVGFVFIFLRLITKQEIKK